MVEFVADAVGVGGRRLLAADLASLLMLVNWIIIIHHLGTCSYDWYEKRDLPCVTQLAQLAWLSMS